MKKEQIKIDSKDFDKIRYEAYDYLRNNEPVYWYEDMQSWFIMKHADVLALSKSDKLVTNELVKAKQKLAFESGDDDKNVELILSFISQWMIYNENPYHSRVRSYMNRVFKKEHIDKVLPEIRKIVDQNFENFEGIAQFDFAKTMAHKIPAQVLSRMIGLDEIDLDTFLKWSDSIALFMQDFVVSPIPNKEIAKSTVIDMLDMKNAFLSSIKKRIEYPQNDLLTDLANGITANEISEEELVLQLIHLIFGGHKIPQFVMTNFLHCLFLNPEMIDQIKLNDDSYLTKVIDEVMRFEAPIQFITRHARVDFELRGKNIKKGDSIFLMLGSANRDEEVFENASTFNPLREKGKHVSFGGGMHVCIGASLVSAEIREIFKRLFSNIDTIKHCYDLDSPKWNPNATFHGIGSLPLEITGDFSSSKNQESNPILECPYKH